MKIPRALFIYLLTALAPLAAACSTGAMGGRNAPHAELIAYYGHGKLFDAEMNEIPPDVGVLADVQQAMLARIERQEFFHQKARDSPAHLQAEAMLSGAELTADEAFLVRGGLIRSYLRDAPPEFRARYDWRNEASLSAYLNRYPVVREQLREHIRRLLELLGFYTDPNQGEDTAYMNYCREQGVPVPPDWAQTGTAWVEQGTLTQNLLSPGEYAAVWTYTDPARRGACVALPRGSGGVGSPAGIICQSATTGAACFWDNIRRGTSPEQFMGWNGQRLVISELKDGTNLNSACTGCHQGNNVYNISPDDPTWAKLLRGPMSGPRPGTFTTVVEASTDTRGGQPRYIPLTTTPARPGWENPYNSSSVCAGCHERRTLTNMPPMPPACASAPGGCYGTP